MPSPPTPAVTEPPFGVAAPTSSPVRHREHQDEHLGLDWREPDLIQKVVLHERGCSGNLRRVLGQKLDDGQKITSVLSELYYRFDEKSNLFKPVVAISPVRADEHIRGPVESLEYSLVDGLPSNTGAGAANGEDS